MLAITSIGEVAHACLNSDQRGVVECVFERSAYVIFNDTYLCIALSSVGCGPLNILYRCEQQALHRALRPAASILFCHADQTLRINDIVIAQLSQACIYVSTGKPIQLDIEALRVHRQAFANMSMPSRGLFSLVASNSVNLTNSTPTCNDSRQAADASVDLALRKFALPILCNLIIWLHSATSSDAGMLKPHKSVCSLLGAGPGLTPSGDDLLAGMLLALQLTGYTRSSEILWTHLQPALASRTNAISAALLQQAALGRSGEFALTALMMYASRDTLDSGKLAMVLARIGATSGWDFLAGVVLVFDAVSASATDSRH